MQQGSRQDGGAGEASGLPSFGTYLVRLYYTQPALQWSVFAKLKRSSRSCSILTLLPSAKARKDKVIETLHEYQDQRHLRDILTLPSVESQELGRLW